ncbi:MAG: hypothetical protein ACE5GW_00615 [Planctomycetota bacterium]
MTHLPAIISTLRARGIDHALIGAIAMSVHGVARATCDVDLLIVDPRGLEEATWGDLRAAGAELEIRRGDADDPLAGVVRIDPEGERPVDVIAGKAAWQREILERSSHAATIDDVAIPAVGAADLILLKLYAGGTQDRWDIEELLATGEQGSLIHAVEERVATLPMDSRQLWERLRGES